MRFIGAVLLSCLGLLLCFSSLLVWKSDAVWALMVPLFALGTAIFFVLTVKPQDRIFTQDIVQATDMFHVAMLLGGICLGSIGCSTLMLFVRLTWVPLGAIYFNAAGSIFILWSVPAWRKFIQSH